MEPDNKPETLSLFELPEVRANFQSLAIEIMKLAAVITREPDADPRNRATKLNDTISKLIARAGLAPIIEGTDPRNICEDEADLIPYLLAAHIVITEKLESRLYPEAANTTDLTLLRHALNQLEINNGEQNATIIRLAKLLDATAMALKGPSSELSMHSWHDIPELAEKARKTAAKAQTSELAIFLLNARQHRGDMHSYTCGNDSRHLPLIATPSGWKCANCDYTQPFRGEFTMSEDGQATINIPTTDNDTLSMLSHMKPAPLAEFTCPDCGTKHSRGSINGDKAYRCLNCGTITNVAERLPRPPAHPNDDPVLGIVKGCTHPNTKKTSTATPEGLSESVYCIDCGAEVSQHTAGQNIETDQINRDEKLARDTGDFEALK